MKVLSFLLGFILGGLFIAFVAVYGFGEEEEPEKQYVEIKPKSVIRPFREYLCPLSVLWRRFLLPFLST